MNGREAGKGAYYVCGGVVWFEKCARRATKEERGKRKKQKRVWKRKDDKRVSD
jgi:hypothetical protein